MKKLFSICTLIFLSLSAWSIRINQSFSGTSFTTTLNDDGLSYYFSVTEKPEGYTFSGPPVFSFYKDGWYLGEIRASGILKHTLNPDSDAFSVNGTKAFQKVTNPALNPDLIGVGKSFEWGDLASFYPFGFFADVNNKKVYFSSLVLDRKFTEENTYMPQWSDLKNSGLSMYNILGFNDSFQRKNFRLSSSALYQFVYRQSYGITGTSGFNLDSVLMGFQAGVFRRISNNSGSDSIGTIGYYLSSDGIEFTMIFKTYQKPVFGGTVQKKSIEMDTSYSTDFVSVSVKNSLSADVDTGKTGTTEYKFGYKENNLGIGAEIGINRIRDTALSINKLSINLDCSNAKFCINGAKFTLGLTFEENGFKFTVDQDRKCSISASFEM